VAEVAGELVVGGGREGAEESVPGRSPQACAVQAHPPSLLSAFAISEGSSAFIIQQ
jgi:hypothetical protein